MEKHILTDNFRFYKLDNKPNPFTKRKFPQKYKIAKFKMYLKVLGNHMLKFIRLNRKKLIFSYSLKLHPGKKFQLVQRLLGLLTYIKYQSSSNPKKPSAELS